MIDFLIGFFKKNKKLCFVVIALIAILALIIFLPGTDAAEEAAEDGVSDYRREMEKELSELCSSVEGVGKCAVSISFSKGAESVYKSGKLTVTNPPKVLGVAVVCRGAKSDKVRKNLTDLIVALYDIPSVRVAILPLE